MSTLPSINGYPVKHQFTDLTVTGLDNLTSFTICDALISHDSNVTLPTDFPSKGMWQFSYESYGPSSTNKSSAEKAGLECSQRKHTLLLRFPATLICVLETERIWYEPPYGLITKSIANRFFCDDNAVPL